MNTIDSLNLVVSQWVSLDPGRFSFFLTIITVVTTSDKKRQHIVQPDYIRYKRVESIVIAVVFDEYNQ